MNPLSIGVIGAGLFGRKHIDTMRPELMCRLAAIADPTPEAGPVLTNAVHDIDDLRFICGELVSVQAVTSNADRRFAVEDTAVILLQIASGALGTLTVSDTAAAPWSWASGENPFYPQNPENCYLIAGAEGPFLCPGSTSGDTVRNRRGGARHSCVSTSKWQRPIRSFGNCSISAESFEGKRSRELPAPMP